MSLVGISGSEVQKIIQRWQADTNAYLTDTWKKNKASRCFACLWNAYIQRKDEIRISIRDKNMVVIQPEVISVLRIEVHSLKSTGSTANWRERWPVDCSEELYRGGM